jgi:hypothetical protein
MKHFINSATGEPWAFDDDVVVENQGGQLTFKTAHGEPLSVPATLVAAAAPGTTIAEFSAAKNTEINAWRLAANLSTFTHGGKIIACDALSRSDIDGVNGYVALYGSLPPAFPGAWKAVDNSYLPIADVTAWKGFYAAMVAQGAANFAHTQALKGQLQAILDANALPAEDPVHVTDDDARAAIEAIIP